MEEVKTTRPKVRGTLIVGLVFESVIIALTCLSPQLVIITLFVPFINVAVLCFPVLGITFGIIGIIDYATKPQTRRKANLVLGIIDTAFPIVFVLGFILLLSTNVLVIRFM